MTTPTVIENKKMLRLDSAAFTDPGLKRELNQDVIFHQTGQTDQGENVGLFLVCDGIGGHKGGEIASRIATDAITGELAELFSPDLKLPDQHEDRPSYLALAHKIEAAIHKANENIRQYAQNHPGKTPELGTTVTLALVYDRLAHIVNVGHSRTYVWRNDELTQITHDHSFAAKLAEQGLIDEAKIPDHPQSNVLLRSLGASDEIKVDVFDWTLAVGDKLLLCSDGLWKAIKEPAELAHWLGKPTTAADLCQQLINQAKARDGSDNISAIVIGVTEVDCP
jgi:serine/threonine protein phosphatase PrpC